MTETGDIIECKHCGSNHVSIKVQLDAVFGLQPAPYVSKTKWQIKANCLKCNKQIILAHHIVVKFLKVLGKDLDDG